MKTTFLVVSATVLFSQVLHSQPFDYSLLPLDDRGNCALQEMNIRTGEYRSLVDSVGRGLQLFVSYPGPLLFVQNRSTLDVWSVGPPSAYRRLLDEIEWVHEVLDLPATARTFISYGTFDSCFQTAILARDTWSTLDVTTEFWSEQQPILSSDGSKVYRLDSGAPGLTFDRFDGMTGEVDSVVVPVSPVSEFAFKPQVQDGCRGLALVSYEAPPGGFQSQHLMVCDLEAGLCHTPFSVEFRCRGRFSSDARFVLVEQVDWDSTTPSLESYPGRVRLHESSTGRLVGEVTGPVGAHMVVSTDPPPIAYFALGAGIPGVGIDTPSATSPRLASLSPALTLARSGEFAMTITGNGFVPESQVLWNNSERTTSFVSPSELQAVIRDADIFFRTTATVTVRNPGGQVSDTLTFSAVNTLPAPVRPVLECVRENPGGTCTAWFGYKNENPVPVYLPAGPRNKFAPPPQNRGQTTVFLPGRMVRVFSVDFPGNNLVWTLNGRTSTASKKSARCP